MEVKCSSRAFTKLCNCLPYAVLKASAGARAMETLQDAMHAVSALRIPLAAGCTGYPASHPLPQCLTDLYPLLVHRTVAVRIYILFATRSVSLSYQSAAPDPHSFFRQRHPEPPRLIAANSGRASPSKSVTVKQLFFVPLRELLSFHFFLHTFAIPSE